MKQNLDDAIRYVNDRPHPLALYGVATSKKTQGRSGYPYNDSTRCISQLTTVTNETISGSLTFNDFGTATISKSCSISAVEDVGLRCRSIFAVRWCRG